MSYINEVASNVRGGANQETQDAEQIYFGGSFDLERIFAVPGAKLIFSLTDRNGQSLSVKAKLNTLLEVQEIPWRPPNFPRVGPVETPPPPM